MGSLIGKKHHFIMRIEEVVAQLVRAVRGLNPVIGKFHINQLYGKTSKKALN